MSESNINTKLEINQQVTVVLKNKEIDGTVVGYIVKFKEVYSDCHNIHWLDNGASVYTHGIIGEKPRESMVISVKLKTD